MTTILMMKFPPNNSQRKTRSPVLTPVSQTATECITTGQLVSNATSSLCRLRATSLRSTTPDTGTLPPRREVIRTTRVKPCSTALTRRTGSTSQTRTPQPRSSTSRTREGKAVKEKPLSLPTLKRRERVSLMYYIGIFDLSLKIDVF